MKDKTKIIRFILTATIITVCWFCLAEGVVFAKQPGKEHSFSLSEIFTDENQNVQPGRYDEEKAWEWFYFLDKKESSLDPYLSGFLYPMLRTLLVEQDSNPMARKEHKPFNRKELEK